MRGAGVSRSALLALAFLLCLTELEVASGADQIIINVDGQWSPWSTIATPCQRANKDGIKVLVTCGGGEQVRNMSTIRYMTLTTSCFIILSTGEDPLMHQPPPPGPQAQGLRGRAGGGHQVQHTPVRHAVVKLVGLFGSMREGESEEVGQKLFGKTLDIHL